MLGECQRSLHIYRIHVQIYASDAALREDFQLGSEIVLHVLMLGIRDMVSRYVRKRTCFIVQVESPIVFQRLRRNLHRQIFTSVFHAVIQYSVKFDRFGSRKLICFLLVAAVIGIDARRKTDFPAAMDVKDCFNHACRC